MKKVTFVPNTPDDLHCVPAVFRMVYKYFLNKDLSWEEIDQIMESVPGKGTWTFPGLTALAKEGLKITHIEPLDYEKLYKEGEQYLSNIFGEDTADYYLNKSNIASVIKYIPDYLENVKQITKEASLEEIINFLKEGALVGIEVDAGRLNKTGKFSLHYVLLYNYGDKNITFHDPGLPPVESRKITLEEFKKAFDYKGANKTFTAFQSGK